MILHSLLYANYCVDGELTLEFSRFRGSVTKSIFYISARTSFIVRFYIFETLE